MNDNELIAIAAYSGRRKEVKSLLDKKINPNLKYRKETLLHWAAQEGKLTVCKLLISYGAKLELKNDLGETPIFKSIEHPRVLSFLIKNGAKANVRRKDRSTPLHLACAFGYEKSVNILLENEADTWLKDENNRTPMYWAGIYRHAKIKELIQIKRHQEKL